MTLQVSSAAELVRLDLAGALHGAGGTVYFVPPQATALDGTALRHSVRFTKRLLDVLLALALGPVSLPLVAAAAVAIKLNTPGPVLFWQWRVGWNGRLFRMVKLRTMVIGNDESRHVAYVAELIRGEAAQQAGGIFKITDDPRVTRIGGLLRRLSIDELPQIFNVLRGDMSIVGPRPALPREVELYDERASQRLKVRPGLIDLWQVSGRSELDFRAMVDLDVAYWERWTLTRELTIILKTPAAVLNRRGTA